MLAASARPVSAGNAYSPVLSVRQRVRWPRSAEFTPPRTPRAGLDVYESEPAPPAELLDLDNVVLTPHVAGWSPEAVQNSVDRFMENARRHLAGEAPVTPL